MKKLFLTGLVCLLFSIGSFAQGKSGFGIKGGLNYNSNGDIVNSVTDAAEDPDGNVGFHLGVYGKIGRGIFFKPELMYTQTKSDYSAGELTLKRIDAPLLVGFRLIGPLNVFVGPAFQFIIDKNFENLNISDLDDNITAGLHFGVGVNLGNLGIDLRYERGFSSNEANLLDNNGIVLGTLDTRPEQLILSVSFGLKGGKNKNKS
ncbi:MAG: hypothetical protein BM564_06010 [Bacteroidetes bacterium MedPE-SWsnd-G2]|nr:MAG: hypothetical protein BM564_06010 [Bacteroidetes bacterium MedPE-SWsnd-G2]